MIKGTKNQLANVGNKFQTDARKVLVVCSAGLLRSPTVANALHKELGFNTRAVGACKEFAIIPVTQALIWWADEIVFVDKDSLLSMEQEELNEINDVGCPITTLNIPDEYNWGDEELSKDAVKLYKQSWETDYE